MGSLFFLNDSELGVFWRKNIFKLENILIIESIISIILSFIAILSFPYEAIKLINQKITIDIIEIYSLCFSFILLLNSLYIKLIHVKNKIKPNYRLCIMNFLAHIGIFFSFICFMFSLYINLIIIEWEDKNNISVNRSLSTHKRIFISFGRAVFAIIWSNLNLFCYIFFLIDYMSEMVIISKAAKYLSTGNNINNKDLLFELFKIPKIYNNNYELNKNDFYHNFNNDKENNVKFRLIMSNDIIENNDNSFNNNNEFTKVEIMQKIVYKSIGVQTDDEINNCYYNNYICENHDKLIDEDVSNNLILFRNKSLIDAKTSINDILNSPIK